MTNKESFNKLIHSNIDEYGYHITFVNSSTEPRYVYTIGLHKKFDFELVFAGGIFYKKSDIHLIFDTIINELNNDKNISKIGIQGLGNFTLSRVDESWCKLMLLGVYDFFNLKNFNAIQIIPDENHYTLDVPNLSKKFEPLSESIWKWLTSEWEYPISRDLTVVTNLDALKGKTITEIMRWEEDEFEMFAGAGPDVEKEDIRIAPIGTILGIDSSISPALKLTIGKGIWREKKDKEWNKWG